MNYANRKERTQMAYFIRYRRLICDADNLRTKLASFTQNILSQGYIHAITEISRTKNLKHVETKYDKFEEEIFLKSN